MEQINRFIRNLICLPIFLYQILFSHLMAPCCRYHPSCSQYAIAAVKQRGVFMGLWLAFGRVLRCHPWARGGYDPVSPNKEKF
jgi:uncharacterized protein